MANEKKPQEWYIEHVDGLEQQVINVWGQYTSIGHRDALSSEFMALFELACRYRQAKRTASNHREFNVLTVEEDAEEKDSRLAFAKAYKALDDSNSDCSSSEEKTPLNARRAVSG